MSIFIDHTKRSADELLADFSACRQLRHISAQARQELIRLTFMVVAKCIYGHKQIKHPDPTNLCSNCGAPRSKYSGGTGLCYRCYGISGEVLWVEDVFMTAVRERGFSCDACGSVYKPKDEEHQRRAVLNMLENMDGAVKPVLCLDCATDFKKFASRSFGKACWRTAPGRDIEKILLAWFAQKVKVLAERVKNAA